MEIKANGFYLKLCLNCAQLFRIILNHQTACIILIRPHTFAVSKSNHRAMIAEKSLTWPNQVHRAILSELNGFQDFMIIKNQVIYSTNQMDFSININEESGSVMVGYAIEREHPFRFHRIFCEVKPKDQFKLNVLKSFIKDIQNGRTKRNHQRS